MNFVCNFQTIVESHHTVSIHALAREIFDEEWEMRDSRILLIDTYARRMCMVEVDQHQMPLSHALDRAKKAITKADDARYELQQAHLASDPQRMQAAKARLLEAEHEVSGAITQLEHHDTESHHQEILQTMTQLKQADQENKIASESVTEPKQIR
ncbi:hypothetical protein ACFFK0_30155 [Paenibacillus chartarius]|uniref:ATPase n=1 Tax=Paenibacillus chartarius TaxID=747481 RepID=A0ABV6DVJ1_9BACL